MFTGRDHQFATLPAIHQCSRLSYGLVKLTREIYHLFPDAEAREDAVQQVVRVDGSDHLAELIESTAEGQGDEFGWVVEQNLTVSLLQVADARIDVVTTAALARSQRRTHQ